MFSLKYAILVLTLSQCHSEESLTERLCSDENLKVETLVRPFGTPFLYLIAENLVFKLEIKSTDKSVIKSSQTLQDWNPEIRQTIDYIYATKKDPKYIKLVNCGIGKEWIIRHEDNHYNGSVDYQKCLDSEYVIDDKTGDQFFLVYFHSSKELVLLNPFFQIEWKIRALIDNPDTIKAFDRWESIVNTVPFSELEGHLIKAAFIHEEHWYLFGGRHYCRVNMKNFDKCRPKLISEWISNCDPNFEESSSTEKESKDKPKAQNKDYSLYVIIVVIILAVFGIIITFIGLLICKEYRKKSKKYNTPNYSKTSLSS